MANISTFLGAASGGGGGVEVSGTGTYHGNQVPANVWFNHVVTHHNAGQLPNIFHVPSTTDPDVYSITNPDSTFTDIVNISSATNGGALYWVSAEVNLGSNISSAQAQIRVTIDGGSATTYSAYDRSTTLRTYHAKWGVYGSAEMTTNRMDVDFPSSFGTENQIYPQHANYVSDQGWHQSQGVGTSLSFFNIPPKVCQLYSLPYLYFESSLRIEGRMSAGGSGETMWAGVLQF